MKRKKHYSRILSEVEIKELQEWLIISSESYIESRKKKQQRFIELINEKGVENFAWWLTGLLESIKEPEFKPDPRFYPELRDSLEEIQRKGWPIQNLKGSRIGQIWEQNKIRFELPLDVDVSEYLQAMQAYQKYFQSLVASKGIQKYLADEHGNRKTYKELAEELNAGIKAWANGESNLLFTALGLHSFLASKGYTPDNFELYDEEKVRRIVKYYWTNK